MRRVKDKTDGFSGGFVRKTDDLQVGVISEQSEMDEKRQDLISAAEILKLILERVDGYRDRFACEQLLETVHKSGNRLGKVRTRGTQGVGRFGGRLKAPR